MWRVLCVFGVCMIWPENKKCIYYRACWIISILRVKKILGVVLRDAHVVLCLDPRGRCKHGILHCVFVIIWYSVWGQRRACTFWCPFFFIIPVLYLKSSCQHTTHHSDLWWGARVSESDRGPETRGVLKWKLRWSATSQRTREATCVHHRVHHCDQLPPTATGTVTRPVE